MIDRRVLRAELPRRPDQQLPRLTRLHIERHRIFRRRMGALEVPQLHQLMVYPARIAVGNHQVAFALADLDPRRELRRPRAGGVDGDAGGEHRTVAQLDSLPAQRRRRLADSQHRPTLSRPL